MVSRSRLLGSFKHPLYAKKSSGKGFLTALVCVKGRVQDGVIHQHKFTAAGTAVVTRFLLLLPRHFCFLLV